MKKREIMNHVSVKDEKHHWDRSVLTKKRSLHPHMKISRGVALTTTTTHTYLR